MYESIVSGKKHLRRSVALRLHLFLFRICTAAPVHLSTHRRQVDESLKAIQSMSVRREHLSTGASYNGTWSGMDMPPIAKRVKARTKLPTAGGTADAKATGKRLRGKRLIFMS